MGQKITREEVEWIIQKSPKTGDRVDLRGVDLSGLDLSNADLRHVNFDGANLSKTNLSGANLWASFCGTDLSEANLYKADLSAAKLGGANLKNAKLRRADLSGANLTKAVLTNADLFRAKCVETTFNEANLGGADLTETILIETALNSANLDSVKMSYTNLAGINLSNVEGLETVVHSSRSFIDTQTLQISKGNIPEIFLRGCGLSDWEIVNAKLYNPLLTADEIIDITYQIHELLTGDAIKYNSCFISYSTRDKVFAQRLYNDLQQKGVRCWFAPEDMKVGDKIRSRIDESIRIHDKLLIILSEHSLNSTWVEKEVETAFEEEDKRRHMVLFPIRLDEAVMETNQAWAADIRRTRHIGNFSRWKDRDAYQKAFKRLLRDLKAEG